MPTGVVEAGVSLMPVPGDLDHVAALRAAGELGSKQDVEGELDDIMASMRQFWRLEPDQVLQAAMAYGARLAELYVLLYRAEGADRQYTRVRTQQVETITKELDRQSKTASRLIEVRRQDLEIMR